MEAPILAQLKAVTNRSELAALLGHKPASLSFILYRIPSVEKYRDFEIPKKGGGLRKISAPTARLARLQKRLALVLQACETEITARSKARSLAHGFRPGHSIVTNATAHRSQRYVLNLDLEDFFPTINFGRVRGFFLKNRSYALNEVVATTIAQIACHGPGLPQGAPCSPVISNMLAHILDVRLARLAGAAGCAYSRYADDITFSSHQKSFPTELAHQVGDENTWVLSDELRKIIVESGYRINEKKTRMQCRARRQLVTGLTVNEKINVRTEYYRQVRAACHSLFNSGECFVNDKISGPRPMSIAQLEGRLNHIHFVRDKTDAREAKEKRDKPTATRSLYRRLTFYKIFAAPSAPVIVCEGKTDSVYLKCALRSLSAQFPSLLAVKDGVAIPAVKFFNYNSKANELLQLNGGTSHMKAFIGEYEKLMGFYGHAPRQAPVIALVDNDAGSKEIWSLLASKYKVTVSPISTDAFYAVTNNLFVVKTPEIGKAGHSCI